MPKPKTLATNPEGGLIWELIDYWACDEGETNWTGTGTPPELVHRPQSHVLDLDRARTDEIQGVHIDFLNVMSMGRRCGAAEVGVLGEEMPGNVLGVGFERRQAIGRQLQLAAEDPSLRRRSGSQLLWAAWKCCPRLIKVRWRDLSPTRSERTSRRVK